MDETVRALGNPEFYVTALVARWHAPTGHVHAGSTAATRTAYLVDADGTLDELDRPGHPPLGAADARARRSSPPSAGSHRGERLILVTDGITERRTEGGGRFGVDGLRRAVCEAAGPRPRRRRRWRSSRRSRTAGREPLEDDATVVVMTIA